MLKYEFDFNVPFDNDSLGKGDFFIPVVAECYPVTNDIAPIVFIKIKETYAINISRVINWLEAIRQMETIAVNHFQNEESCTLNVLQLAF